MPQYNLMGLNIQGTLPGSTNRGLTVAEGGFFGKTLEAKSFKGDGTNITNTCSGKSTSSNDLDVSYAAVGLGSSTIGHFTAVTIVRGRPTFSNREIKVAIPGTKDI